MTSSLNNHPALVLKLQRGANRAAGLEICDKATGKLVALLPPGEQSAIVEQLLIAAPDLLWAVVRAGDHLNCEGMSGTPKSSEGPTPETRKLCKLLRQAFALATKLPTAK